MKLISSNIFTVVSLLAQDLAVAQDDVKTSLRAYANNLKSMGMARTGDCELPAEVEGSIDMVGCGKVFFYEKMAGDDKKCVHNGGSTRTNGSFSDIKSAEECANQCVSDEKKVNKIIGMNFNCEKKLCQCLFGQGMVERAVDRTGFTCYAVTSAISGTYALPDGEEMSRYCAEKTQFEL